MTWRSGSNICQDKQSSGVYAVFIPYWLRFNTVELWFTHFLPSDCQWLARLFFNWLFSCIDGNQQYFSLFMDQYLGAIPRLFTGEIDFFWFEIFAGSFDSVAAAHDHALDEKTLKRFTFGYPTKVVEKMSHEPCIVQVQNSWKKNSNRN